MHRKSLRCGRTTIAILISALGGLTTRRSSRPASTSAPMLLKCRRRERPYVLRRESAACRMGPMRRRRSNWQDSSSWNSLPLTPRSNGLRDARVHRSAQRSEEHTSELQSRRDLVCRLLLEKKKKKKKNKTHQKKKINTNHDTK